jgi:hypothetical protein
MYHEEKIINGVLCHRGTPDGLWLAYTPEQLTARLTGYETALKQFAFCALDEDNCASFDVANRRVRGIAQAALNADY